MLTENKPPKSKLPLAHEQSVLELGKWYLVAHAILYKGQGTLVPVHPLHHKDVHFSIKVPHFHIDGRFRIPSGIRTSFFMTGGRTNNVIMTEEQKDSGEFFPNVTIVYRRRKCIRLETGVRPPKTKSGMYWDWYGEYVGKSCKGKMCPHLGTVMVERDGRLECPLHGLIANKETKRIIIPK